jgi:hypothetical protein
MNMPHVQRMVLLRSTLRISAKRMQVDSGVAFTFAGGAFLVTRTLGRTRTATAKFDGSFFDIAASEPMGLSTQSSKAANDSNGSGGGGAAATSGTSTMIRSST